MPYYFLYQRQGPPTLHANKSVETVRHPKRPSPLLRGDGIFAIKLALGAIDFVEFRKLDKPKGATSTHPAPPVVGAGKLVVGNEEPCLDLLYSHRAHVVLTQVHRLEHLSGFVVQGRPKVLELGRQRHGEGPHGVLQTCPVGRVVAGVVS